jgi:hypothetical protein
LVNQSKKIQSKKTAPVFPSSYALLPVFGNFVGIVKIGLGNLIILMALVHVEFDPTSEGMLFLLINQKEMS